MARAPRLAEPWRRLGCRRDPWTPTPDPALFFATAAARKLYTALLTALSIGDGALFLVIGEAGVGKTMLLKVLEHALKSAGEPVTFHSCTVDGADWQDRLDDPNNTAPVLLIDDAELSDKAIGRLQRLLEQRGAVVRGMRLVISGRPELEQRLKHLLAAAVGSKATFARLRLDRLDPEAVGEYVLHRLRQAGYSGPQPLTPEALLHLAEQSEGIPRRINELAAIALAALPLGPPGWFERPAPDDDAPGRGRLALLLASALVATVVLAFAVPDWTPTAGESPSLSPELPTQAAASEAELPALDTDRAADVVLAAALVPTPDNQPAPVPDKQPAPLPDAASILPPEPPIDLEAENDRIMGSILETVQPAAGGDAAPSAAAPEPEAAPSPAVETEGGSAAALARPTSQEIPPLPQPTAETPPVAVPTARSEPAVARVPPRQPQPTPEAPAVAVPAPAEPAVVRVPPPPPAAETPAAAVPLAPGIDRAHAASLVARGDEQLKTGDIAAARLLYERAATGGYSPAMTALGRTYDPEMLKRWGVIGIAPDPERARQWYRKAAGAAQ